MLAMANQAPAAELPGLFHARESLLEPCLHGEESAALHRAHQKRSHYPNE